MFFFYEMSATGISYSEECVYNVAFDKNINPSDPLRYWLTKNMHLHFLSLSNPSVKILVLLVLNINDNYSH